MPFKRHIEIGRVAQINYGKEYGRLVVIVDVIDHNRVMKIRDVMHPKAEADSEIVIMAH